MIEIPARKLLTIDYDTLTERLKGKFILVFDNGDKISTTHKEVLFSICFWEPFKRFPNIPLLPIHHISYHYSQGFFHSKSHVNLASAILKSILTSFTDNEKVDVLSIVTKDLFDGLDKIFTKFLDNSVEYTHSVDILDFIELQHDYDVLGVMDTIEKAPNFEVVTHAYKIIDNVLERHSKENVKNNVVKTYVTKCSSDHQIKQCIGPRGYIADINFTIFNIPVTRSFTMGMGHMYNTAVESRSAAKALYLSIKALGDSEDFAKAIQLACMSVQRIHYEDCGSTRYMEWIVKPPNSKEGNKHGDLVHMVGMKYLDSDSGQLKTISKEDTHLYGKTIKIRNPIYCKHKDKYGICSTCFGDLAYTIPKDSNIGHFSAVEMTMQISQSILSTKHLEESKQSTKVSIPAKLNHILVPTLRGKGYGLLLPSLKDIVEIKLYIPKKSILISDIELIEDISNANIFRLSSVDLLELHIVRRNKRDPDNPKLYKLETYILPVSHQNTPGSFTLKFLEYIRKYGVTESKTNVIVDLSKWKSKVPFVMVRDKEFEFSKLESVIESLLKSKVNSELIKNNPDILLSNLFEQVNNKISVHLSYLSTIIYALCVYDLDNNNYDMGRFSPNLKAASFSSVIEHRSMSAMMLFEGIHKHMTLSYNYYKDYKPDHPLDVLLLPGHIT